jgi:hypothetical protein
VHVVGIAATPFVPEHDAMLDELVFDAVRAALRECGLRKQDCGLTVLASMDVLDGRSISSGLTTAASGGYLTDSYRLEADSGVAIQAAAQAVAACDIELAIAVGLHNPETRSADEATRREFTEQISNLAFEPHADRPIGLTAETVYAMHAAQLVENGGTTIDQIAARTAEDITRGAGRPRAARTSQATAADVLASPRVAWPLHELMLPAHSTGAVAAVLASPARAARTVGRSAVLTGFGHATGQYTGSGQWLHDPGATTRRAAVMAYRQAGITDPPDEIDLAELTAATAALGDCYLAALGLEGALDRKDVNASGGLHSNYPGLANGALRLLEVIEQLDERSDAHRAVAHSADTVTGTVSEDVTVLVVEAA